MLILTKRLISYFKFTYPKISFFDLVIMGIAELTYESACREVLLEPF
jgi:hypothetical protein